MTPWFGVASRLRRVKRKSPDFQYYIHMHVFILIPITPYILKNITPSMSDIYQPEAGFFARRSLETTPNRGVASVKLQCMKQWIHIF